MSMVTIPSERGHAVRSELPNVFSQIGTVCNNHATLAGGNVLIRKEGENSDVAYATSHYLIGPAAESSVKCCTDCVAGIFNQGDAVRRADLGQLGHATEISSIMHNNYG